jgi:hypothetical protein
MIRVTLKLIRSSLETWAYDLELALTLPPDQLRRQVAHTMNAIRSAHEILKSAQLGESQDDQGLQAVTCHGKGTKETDGHG